MWWASRGDTASLLRLARQGASEQRSATNVFALRKAQGQAEIGRAMLPLARRDTAEALRRLMAFPDSLCPGGLELGRVHLLASAGHDREAAAIFDRSAGAADRTFWGARGVLGTLERGRIAERLGDHAAAAKSYQFVMDAWRHADPELRPYVDEARAGLARLSREPARAGE